jgi:hypothetical protein
MCHAWWRRRESRREERFDEELKYLLDEERDRPGPPAPVVEHERDEEPLKPERVHVETVPR